MEILLNSFSMLLILLSVLPFVQQQHWIFRVSEFLKLQILICQLLVFTLSLIVIQPSVFFWTLQGVQAGLIIYHIYILMRYTKFWRTPRPDRNGDASEKIKVISCNIYQYNTHYEQFIELIRNEKPDIFLTMESNSDWEKAMRVLEKDYPHHRKVSLENTYGMHLYTKLKVISLRTHFFVADDLPSIEAELETRDGYRFIFFGVHPPPPSPTEEDNSKERDGDLLSVAKLVQKYALPVVVTGDFNTVAWSRASILFRKTSELIDARIGRGILSTFHAKYWFFRVPLDLLFHSPDIFIDRLSIYPSIGSDHFPIGFTFHISPSVEQQQEKEVEHLQSGEMNEVNKLIAKGQREQSDNRKK